MIMQNCLNISDPRYRADNDPLHGASGLQNSGGATVEARRQVAGSRGTRSTLAFPRNYIPLPDGREYTQAAYAYMNGAGRPLFLEWVGNVSATRLQPTAFSTEQQAQAWRQAEWARQKGRRRFSNKQVLEEYIGKRYATNESAQAAVQQKQFRRPSSTNRFYAFLSGMSAAFGTLE